MRAQAMIAAENIAEMILTAEFAPVSRTFTTSWVWLAASCLASNECSAASLLWVFVTMNPKVEFLQPVLFWGSVLLSVSVFRLCGMVHVWPIERLLEIKVWFTPYELLVAIPFQRD